MLQRLATDVIIAYVLWKCLVGLTFLLFLVLSIDILASTVVARNHVTKQHATYVIRLCESCIIGLIMDVASELYYIASRSVNHCDRHAAG